MKLLTTICLIAAMQAAYSQSNTFIRGNIGIRYSTRATPKGPADIYDLKLNVSDSVHFRGTVAARPFIPGTFSQTLGGLDYTLDTDVVNPANPAQVKNIGRLIGSAPVDGQNVYRFADGNVRMLVRDQDSKLGGLAYGKPPAKTGFLDSIRKEVMSISKQVGGRTVVLSLSDYDKMEFGNVALPAGPVAIYPEAKVDGAMIYDRARSAWHFKNIQIVYADGQRQVLDRLSGDIRWVESPARKTNGEGEYQFDVRVNEPPSSESAVFAQATDEAAFFSTDASIPGLTGTMKYRDTMAAGTVIASAVAVDLRGNRLTKQQTMVLCKLILLTAIVPLNAE